MRLIRLLAEFAATPWALELTTLERMAEILGREAMAKSLRDLNAEAIEPLAAAGKADRAYAAAGAKENVAVIPVWGVIAHRAYAVSDICGPSGTSTEALDQAIRSAAADPSIRSIVLDVNSPGGSVFGVAEVFATIMEARAAKPIAAVANAVAGSAAYWIASAAHEVYVTPSGEVGSIGVFGTHVDTTKADEAAGKVVTHISAGKFKTEGAGPLTAEARDFLQSRVDAYYTQFVRAVAKGRGVSAETVREGYGQGRTLGADAALSAGMVDGVATISEVISKYARRTPEAANRPRALAEAQIALAAAGPTTMACV